MNDDKQYLFTANGSYFGHCLIAGVFLFPVVYGVIDRGFIDLNENNVLMFPLGVALLLSFSSITEACMMIKSKRYLFAYNVDKAICVSLDCIRWDEAVAISCRLYGPVFDKNCAIHFSTNPKSPFLRNLFYILVIAMFSISIVSPCYHIANALNGCMFSSKLIVASMLVLFDAVMIINRLFFRASIRKFWAKTLGNDNFRSILKFEFTTIP